MSEDTLFRTILGSIILAVIAVGLIKLAIMNDKSEALESTVLALMRFGGEYGVMLSKAQTEGAIYREGLSTNDEAICHQLGEVGLFTERPGSWVLSEVGEVALTTISPSVAI